MAPSPTATPECPRCGYDQSGIVASWQDACPLDGVCSECGLAFAWRDVLSIRLVGPEWSFEHGTRRLGRRWLRTVWRSLRPWRLWHELTLVHVVRPRRLFGLAASSLLLMHAAVVVLVLGNNARSPLLIPSLSGRWPWIILWPYQQDLDLAGRIGPPAMHFLLVWTFVQALAIPAGMLALGQTFRRKRVRTVHLLRALCYTLSSAAAVAPLSMAAVVTMVTLGALGVVSQGSTVSFVLFLGILLVFPLWNGLCTWLFVRRYLCLPHAPAVVGVMWLISILAGLAAASWLGILTEL